MKENKKSIFKKWWFWGIIILILFMISTNSTQQGIKDEINNATYNAISNNITNQSLGSKPTNAITNTENDIKTNSVKNEITENTNITLQNTSISSDTTSKESQRKTLRQHLEENGKLESAMNYADIKTSNDNLEVSVDSTSSTTQDTNTDMVWIGDTGTKYHYQSCRTLKGNGHQITLEQALAEGREPCKVCY